MYIPALNKPEGSEGLPRAYPEIIKSSETPGTSAGENPPQEKTPQTVESIISVPTPPASVVDQRTGDEKTHQVEPDADKTTKTADETETKFIEGVEEAHEGPVSSIY